MRASATSRIASAANFAASQAKSNTNQADPASPFALLVDRVAPKDGVKDAKASQKDNSQEAGDSEDKSAVQQDSGTQQDSTTAQTVAQPIVKSTAPLKSGKSDDSKDSTSSGTDQDVPGDSQVAATTLQLLSLQNQPPVPPTQITVQAAAVPGDDHLTVDPAAPAKQAPPSADIPSAAPPADAPVKPANTPALIATQDDQQDDETAIAAGTEIHAAASQPGAPQADAPQPDSKPVQPGKSFAKPVTVAAKPGQNPAPPVGGDGASTQDDAAAAAASAPKDKAVPKPAAGKSETVKAAPPKGDSAKSRFVQDAKTNPDKDADKLAQSAPPQLEAEDVQDIPAPKPAPQPVQALNNNPAIDLIAPAQNNPPSLTDAHALTQHIQVTATPAPNLPALAVEIAAKSQSGAKQFDIRLDPPELGRVDVRLSIDANGKASAHLSADQPQTLSLLQKDAPILTRALRDAGLDVSQDGLNFSLRQQGDNGGNAGNGSRRPRGISLSAAVSIDASALTAAYRGPGNGRLDIRV
ncbi:MAG TPA: flagellar hook-length control protein FliK [Rhizomicrobium sp.]|nr:flagellar hook-length control protein FliK [Rhizomicrobium sp.]